MALLTVLPLPQEIFNETVEQSIKKCDLLRVDLSFDSCFFFRFLIKKGLFERGLLDQMYSLFSSGDPLKNGANGGKG